MPYGSADQQIAKVRTGHLAQWKREGHKWAMLTAYDYSTARVFAEANVPVLLVGDSAANVVYGYDATTKVTLDELIPLIAAVRRGAPQALLIADLPFGSYEIGVEAAFATAVRVVREGGAEAVKIEGGARVTPQIHALTEAGIPVMGHLGFTPQSVNALGGFKVQGRGGPAAEKILADAKALEASGAIGIVLEMVPAEVAAEVTASVGIPTVGIGAGPSCDAQVLVWQDFAGLTRGRVAKFVKPYTQIGDDLARAANEYAAEVAAGTFPGPEHSF